MAGEWARKATFAELINEGALEIGDGYRAKNEQLGGDGPIFLRAGHVKESHIDFSGVERFHARFEPRARSKLSKPGDAVVTTKGNSTGRTMFVTSHMPTFVYSPHLSYWRSKNRDCIEGGFLHYWSKGPEFAEQLAGMKASTDMAPYLSLIDQKRLKISLPPIEQQRAIAHILGTLDDKIDLNRRMSETLEAMARVLFKSWFVDFDPVRAKAEGRDTGLPSEITDLFPDRFVDSERGEIPEGWGIGVFGHVVDFLRDTTNPLSSPDTVFHHFSIPAFDEGQQPRTELGAEIKSLKSRVVAGATLLSKLNPEIDRVWLADVDAKTPAVCSTEFLVLIAQPPFSRSYVYCLARSRGFRQELEGLVTGTSKSHQRVHAATVQSLSVVLPPKAVIGLFDQLAGSLLDRILRCRAESQTLAKLRNSLLPKLISGDLLVKDVYVQGQKAAS